MVEEETVQDETDEEETGTAQPQQKEQPSGQLRAETRRDAPSAPTRR